MRKEVVAIFVGSMIGVTAWAEEPGAFKNQKEKASYALGMNVGVGLKRHPTVELDVDFVVRGLRDAMAGGKTLLSEEEVRAVVADVRREIQAKQAEEAKKQAEKNKQEGEAFLAANKGKEGVVALESGLQYKVLRQGEGLKPTAQDTVECNYRGTLIDGTEFDSSYKRGQPASFPVTGVIKGWTEALQLMPVGSKWQLFIPSALAYGERGAGGTVGPNATLVFEVELLGIKEKAARPTPAGAAKPPMMRPQGKMPEAAPNGKPRTPEDKD